MLIAVNLVIIIMGDVGNNSKLYNSFPYFPIDVNDLGDVVEFVE